jgi:hypothetical protein
MLGIAFCQQYHSYFHTQIQPRRKTHTLCICPEIFTASLTPLEPECVHKSMELTVNPILYLLAKDCFSYVLRKVFLLHVMIKCPFTLKLPHQPDSLQPRLLLYDQHLKSKQIDLEALMITPELNWVFSSAGREANIWSSRITASTTLLTLNWSECLVTSLWWYLLQSQRKQLKKINWGLPQ